MTCRCLKKCKDKRSLIKKEIPSANISIYQLNLTSRNSINDFCKDLFRDFKSIDILINNAAVKEENKVKDESGLNLNLSTNFLGPFLLTLKLLPLLSNEGKGKILNVISPSYFGGRINFSDFNKEKRKYNKYDSYAQSKMALAMMTLSLNEMGEELNVSSLSIDPMSAFSHHGIPKSNFFFNIPNKAIHSLFLKSPLYASQCYLKACIEDFENNKDKVLTHLNWVWYTKYCKDKLTRDKLWLTAKKWTGID
ncbi:hypothetical protein A3Q56_07521 [Intoshia linei]|uniref:Uncharacterized protein n=1 Tax=Intoshia linei TaxID=1819745 RepID=A0A177ARX3_9BILA|nr:hypothetical protein A3Q56_07521 [Intoshia linei]